MRLASKSTTITLWSLTLKKWGAIALVWGDKDRDTHTVSSCFFPLKYELGGGTFIIDL